MRKPSDNVKLRVLQNDRLTVDGLPLLKGMHHRCAPEEASILVSAGIAEVIEGDVPADRSVGSRAEFAAMPHGR